MSEKIYHEAAFRNREFAELLLNMEVSSKLPELKAKLAKKRYQAFRKAGFSHEDSIVLLTNYNQLFPTF